MPVQCGGLVAEVGEGCMEAGEGGARGAAGVVARASGGGVAA